MDNSLIIEQQFNGFVSSIASLSGIEEGAVLCHIQAMLEDPQPGDAGFISFLSGCACEPGAGINALALSGCACQL